VAVNPMLRIAYHDHQAIANKREGIELIRR
jgi:hypothetical protein